MTKKLIEEIKEDEGFSGTVYEDTLGFDTIGFGTKLPLTEEEAELLLRERLNKKIQHLSIYKPIIRTLDQERQDVLANMAYQMGIRGVLNFKKMWKAIENKDYVNASIEMLDSRWHEQTPRRSQKLANIMRG